MADWDKDDFMSQWDKNYVSTNVREGSKAYDKDFFLKLNTDLQSQPGLENISCAIIVGRDRHRSFFTSG